MHFEKRFDCALCGQVCCAVHIGVDEQNRPSLRLRHFSQDGQYVLVETQAAALITLYAEGALKQVLEIDQEYAPFYCPARNTCYCMEHWKRWPTYDDGFYDAEYGICPQGHKRMLFD